MKSITLLHPFSAESIGLEEKDLWYNHSKPHVNALRALSNKEYYIVVEYFTSRCLPYSKKNNKVKKQFWPITSPIVNNRHQWRKQHSFFHLLKIKIRPPDLTIINMSGHGSPYIFKLGKLLKKKKKPYLAMIGGMNVSISNKPLEYYKNAHCIIVHTQYQKKLLQKLKEFNEMSIQVLPLGVDTELFKPDIAYIKTTSLLYVGRISRLKQIELAIQTLDSLVNHKNIDATLTIIGPMSDLIYYDELNKMVVNLKLKSKIKFIGSLNQEELIPHYQQASLLMLPSKHESFGMVMVESMACGTPVIALKGSGGPDEVIRHGYNGYLCSESNLNDTVYNLLSNTILLNIMSTNCRKSVIESFSLKKTELVLKIIVKDVFLSAVSNS